MFRIIIPLILLGIYWFGPLATESVDGQYGASELQITAKNFIQPTLDCVMAGDYSFAEDCRHEGAEMMGLVFSAAAVGAALAALFGVLGMLSFLSGIAGFFAVIGGAVALAATGWFTVDAFMNKSEAIQIAWGAWASGGVALLMMLLGLVSMREE